jgi:hypothetical protein
MDVEEQKYLIEQKEREVEGGWEPNQTTHAPRTARSWLTTCVILYGITTTILLAKNYVWDSGLPVPYCK